ncbi:hypothetical protein EJB05_09471 [Eragrostis curvula]|uniref:DOG1 domain-containing protein n=1 Tax=Eragrostis curvula TaxID=38414 RepID=A0A5J9W555_9POAL|nr:hypothetical protein EJB05_09471 [Eragrostis curvula]
MTSAASVGVPMGIYDYDRRGRQHPFAAAVAWGGEAFRPDTVVVNAQPVPTVSFPNMDVPRGEPKLEIQAHEDAPVEEAAPSSDSFGHDDGRHSDKALRRLAQNREAARKSRLRKKAYIQTLESSRLKLAHMEQELTRVRRQQVQLPIAVQQRASIGQRIRAGSLLIAAAIAGLCRACSSAGEQENPLWGYYHHPSLIQSSTGNSETLLPLLFFALLRCALPTGAAAFELEYARWAEEQGRHAGELRAALQAEAAEPHLRCLVDAALAHYDALFAAKSDAARRDAFHVVSGAWRAPAERFFLWIGGFRPSDLLATLAPQLGPLADDQASAVRTLQRTARQLEDALSQGLDKLHQTLTEALTAVDVDGGGGYAAQQEQMAGAVGKLAGLASFVEQADHLRQQTLRNMHKILTPRQAATGLLALADYCQRLRALSSLWAARPREPA